VPRAERVWNRIPRAVRDSVIQLALGEPALIAARAGGPLHRHEGLFHIKASVYRLLKA
jgi:hypothetical protein